MGRVFTLWLARPGSAKVEPQNLEDDPKYFKDFKLTRRFPKFLRRFCFQKSQLTIITRGSWISSLQTGSLKTNSTVQNPIHKVINTVLFTLYITRAQKTYIYTFKQQKSRSTCSNIPPFCSHSYYIPPNRVTTQTLMTGRELHSTHQTDSRQQRHVGSTYVYLRVSRMSSLRPEFPFL